MARDYTLQALRATTVNRLADTPADGEFVVDTTLRTAGNPFVFVGDGATAGGTLVPSVNLYTANGALTGNRTVTIGANSLNLSAFNAGEGLTTLFSSGNFVASWSNGLTTATLGASSTAAQIEFNSVGTLTSVKATASGVGLDIPAAKDVRINTDAGTAGQYFGSNGPNVAPTWQTLATPDVTRIHDVADTTALDTDSTANQIELLVNGISWLLSNAGNNLVFTSPSGRTITFNDIGANAVV